MHIQLIKTLNGWGNANEAAEKIHKRTKLGGTIHAPFKQMRNAAFHRKLFALFNLAYEYWEPGEVSSRHGNPEKNFDRFRKDLVILAGHYHSVIRLDGTVRIAPDSLSFGNMNQETFNDLYQNILDVIMKRIPVLNELNEDEIEDLVNKVLEFA